ncbi:MULTISPECIES: TIGR03943 family putative permease subunit [Brevibacillus]|uniref:TIGR03943 family putative permease subunit n=2 Tax=Brevibacillus TaxID=55080 RepID=UPI00046AE499|nr:TIGR03943 family protein [Brevibacillus borstelensis]MCC0565294.1 TIGR03943 family protein [Brevibacillus borstelensis]MCM3470851.1 TIGR03943 family protein [Brevibacillus borstelensis]MCM3559372.1 TIGR03943 family protein [Brevibacillus borstelensis]MCM3590691.1 TIGR03943 family protein [Brevibacillus borstelensis]MCM3622522.1 TIGR03943 family protein [Brevibacillus borstelensis]
MDANAVKRHYWVRSFLLAGFTVLLAELIWSGSLSQYLAPRLHMLSYVTLGVFCLLTIASIRQAVIGPTAYECDCEDAHKLPRNRWISIVVYSLFALPLLMGFVMPDKILGSSLAEKRGVTLLTGESHWVKKVTVAAPLSEEGAGGESGSGRLPESSGTGQKANAAAITGEAGDASSSRQEVEVVPIDSNSSGTNSIESKNTDTGHASGNTAATDEELRALFNPEQFGGFYTDLAVKMYKQPVILLDDKLFLDGLTTMDLFSKEFAGKEVQTMGFVYREAGFSPEQFVVARFSVSCCTADATVFGILVEVPEASKWKTDSWVQVRGKLELRKVNEYDMLVLKASKVEKVEAPKDPYVYYNFETAPSP